MLLAQQGCEAMDKSEDAFRTISEAAEELDLPQHVLRFWETRFPQIRPMKRGGGRRYYRPDDVELLRAIRHLLYNEGYTIKGVQRMLKERGVRAVLAMPAQSSSDRPVSGAPGESPPPVRASALEPARTDVAAPAALIAPSAEADAADDLVLSRAASHAAQQAQAPRAPSWTLAHRKAVEAIVAELAECRRILGSASI